MDTTLFTNPAIVGPGIWYKLHIEACNATSDILKEAFIINVNADCDNFKCKKCQPHFRKFINTHPLRDYWNITDVKGRDIGFFKWTWELHNQVNKHLGKYCPKLDEAFRYYNQAEQNVCYDCQGHRPSTNPNPTAARPNNSSQHAISHKSTSYGQQKPSTSSHHGEQKPSSTHKYISTNAPIRNKSSHAPGSSGQHLNIVSKPRSRHDRYSHVIPDDKHKNRDK